MKKESLMVKGLGHISIACTDIDRSVKFYTTALGFHKTYETSLDNMIIVFLEKGELTIELVLTKGNSPVEYPNGAINHFALVVKDIDECIRSVKEAGQPITVPKGKLTLDAPIFYAFYEGPDKERVELVQYR